MQVLVAVPIKALFHWFSPMCVGRGSKAVARSGPVSQGWPVSVVGSLQRDASRCWGTAAQQQIIKSCPTQPGPCCAFPHHIHCKIHVLLLQREMSRSQIWPCLGCKSPHLSCVCREGGGGWLYSFNDCIKIIHLPVGPLGSTFPSAVHVTQGNIWLTSFFEAPQPSYISEKPRAANHWQSHSFTIFWLRNSSSCLLWCFLVPVSWGQDFSTGKATGAHLFKGKVFPLSWYRLEDV